MNDYTAVEKMISSHGVPTKQAIENLSEANMSSIQTMVHCIGEALKSDSLDQRRIAEEGLKFIDTLLHKNKDYGGSVWKQPVLTPTMSTESAILVRMSDKVSRLIQLSENEAQIFSETFDDTVMDLGAYCLLYLARPERDNNAAS